MPKIKIDGEKWKYKIGREVVIITSPVGDEFVAGQDEITCESNCFVSKDDVKEYIERELL